MALEALCNTVLYKLTLTYARIHSGHLRESHSVPGG